MYFIYGGTLYTEIRTIDTYKSLCLCTLCVGTAEQFLLCIVEHRGCAASLLVQVGCVCNNAQMKEGGAILGHPVDGALLALAGKVLVVVCVGRGVYVRVLMHGEEARADIVHLLRSLPPDWHAGSA